MTEQMNDNERSMKLFVIFALLSAVLLPVLGEFYVVGDFYWSVSRWLTCTLVFVWTAAAGICFGRLPFRKAMLGCAAFALSSLVLGMVGFAVIHPLFKRGLNDFEEYFAKTDVLSGSTALQSSSTNYYFDWIFYWGMLVGALAVSFLAAFITLGIRRLKNGTPEDERTSSAIDNAFSEDEE